MSEKEQTTMEPSATENGSTVGTVSGLQLYWKKINDFKLRRQVREALGMPSNSTFSDWLAEPGKIKASLFLAMWEVLRPHFPELAQHNGYKHLLKKY